jgi:hypothetical protein
MARIASGSAAPDELEAFAREAGSPYRSARAAHDGDESAEALEHVHPVLVIVWVASLARVVGAFWTREVLGADATLAALMFLGISWYAYACSRQNRR